MYYQLELKDSKYFEIESLKDLSKLTFTGGVKY